MTYRLNYNPGVEAVHDALPEDASERLSAALAAVCEDPMDTTVQYGEDDGGVIRTLVADDVMAVLLIGQTFKTVTVLQLTYLG